MFITLWLQRYKKICIKKQFLKYLLQKSINKPTLPAISEKRHFSGGKVPFLVKRGNRVYFFDAGWSMER